MKPLWPNWYVTPGRLSTPALTEYVAAQFRTSTSALRGDCRAAHSVRARAALVYALHRYGIGEGTIGRMVNRDRTTARHALKMIPIYRRDGDFAKVIDRIDMLTL